MSDHTSIAEKIWQSALDSLNSDSHSRVVLSQFIIVLIRAFMTSKKFMLNSLCWFTSTDRVISMFSQIVHAHHKTPEVFATREILHARFGWYHDHYEYSYEWKATNFHNSAFHVKFLSALVAEGVYLILVRALTSAKTHSNQVDISLAISTLPSSAEVEHSNATRVAVGRARDMLRKAIINCSTPEHFVYNCMGLKEAARDKTIMAAALARLGGDDSWSTAPVRGVKVTVKRGPDWARGSGLRLQKFAFYGRHVLSDGSIYQGHWIRVDRDQPPHPLYNHTSCGSSGAFLNGCSYCEINGKFHGPGTIFYSNGDSYHGEWVEGRKSGKGAYKWGSGYYFSGEWIEGRPKSRITRGVLLKSKHAVLVQGIIRCHLARLDFRRLCNKFLLDAHRQLNGHCFKIATNQAVFFSKPLTDFFSSQQLNGHCFRITKNQAVFFTKPLIHFMLQVACTARQHCTQASCSFRQRAASPFNSTCLWHAAPGSTRGCLSALNQTERCRIRCREVVFLADRLILRSLGSVCRIRTSEYSLVLFSGWIVDRVFRGFSKRIAQAGFLDDDYGLLSSFFVRCDYGTESTMEIVD
jgi:hypothetical protein